MSSIICMTRGFNDDDIICRTLLLIQYPNAKHIVYNRDNITEITDNTYDLITIVGVVDCMTELLNMKAKHITVIHHHTLPEIQRRALNHYRRYQNDLEKDNKPFIGFTYINRREEEKTLSFVLDEYITNDKCKKLFLYMFNQWFMYKGYVPKTNGISEALELMRRNHKIQNDKEIIAAIKKYDAFTDCNKFKEIITMNDEQMNNRFLITGKIIYDNLMNAIKEIFITAKYKKYINGNTTYMIPFIECDNKESIDDIKELHDYAISQTSSGVVAMYYNNKVIVRSLYNLYYSTIQNDDLYNLKKIFANSYNKNYCKLFESHVMIFDFTHDKSIFE